MNRTQKNALCPLVFLLSFIIVISCVSYRIFVLKKSPESFAGRFLPLAVLILVNGPLLIWMFKRQSPKEPGADERDKLIENRAAMVFFISALFLFPAIGVIPKLILGDDACIPAWLLPLINFGIYIIGMMIYFAAILVQYFSWRGNGKR